MSTKSVVALLCAIATVGLLATSAQALPGGGLARPAPTAEQSLTRVDFDISDIGEMLLGGGDDEGDESDITDMAGDLVGDVAGDLLGELL
jgi:hypothetical protein